MNRPSKEKAACKTCHLMEPEITKNGRNIFYCMHPEARTECMPHRIITRSRNQEIPTKSAPKWCPLNPGDDGSKNRCRNCKYAEGYGGLDGFHCRALNHGIRGEQYGCQYFSQRKEKTQ